MRLQWDLLCRVIDNFGDIGVCYRLASDLAQRGHRVRLWVDDASALAWMAPQDAPAVEVLPWSDQSAAWPGDVVVEAFGCNPEPAFVHAMAAKPLPPVWINLEYLSAETYVERCHGLASPVLSGPAAGLHKWFYYPGFTPSTGGLLRERGLLTTRQAFEPQTWLSGHGVAVRPGERLVSLFCYENALLAPLLSLLDAQPTLLLLAPGAAQTHVQSQSAALFQHLRWQAMPWLTQADYDRLLWACDINFVRGEDSFVRAQWAARPFVWQIYPQHDGAHAVKLEAFLDRYLHAAPSALGADLRRLWHAWNGLGPLPAALPGAPAWRDQAVDWARQAAVQPDLCSQLIRFVLERQ